MRPYEAFSWPKWNEFGGSQARNSLKVSIKQKSGRKGVVFGCGSWSPYSHTARSCKKQNTLAKYLHQQHQPPQPSTILQGLLWASASWVENMKVFPEIPWHNSTPCNMMHMSISVSQVCAKGGVFPHRRHFSHHRPNRSQGWDDANRQPPANPVRPHASPAPAKSNSSWTPWKCHTPCPATFFKKQNQTKVKLPKSHRDKVLAAGRALLLLHGAGKAQHTCRSQNNHTMTQPQFQMGQKIFP